MPKARGACKQMKRVGNLYAAIYRTENIQLAHHRAQRGKGHYHEVKMVNADPDRHFGNIHYMLRNKTFRNSSYVRFNRVEGGKLREIFKLPYFPDRIIHHCIMNVLEPIWRRVFIRDSYSSIKGRGIHDGVKRMKKFLADEPGTRYCLKFDIRKFYPSIDHNILKHILRKKIKCRETLWLLDAIINSAPGVPIGNYLSQYFANLYLTDFDHWIKEEKHIKYYARYCDDMVVLHSSKKTLHDLFAQIVGYLHAHLKFEIKHTWQVFPSRIRGIDFLGYRFFGSHTLVRKSIATKFSRKARQTMRRQARPNDVNALMSYWGWLKHANAYNLWNSRMDIKLKSHLPNCGGIIPRQLEVS